MAKIKEIKTKQDPAYRLFTAEFLVRNMDMTDDQVGKFIKLLCFQHQNGHMTEETMLMFCKEKDNKIFSRFLVDSKGLYYNKEMDDEIIRRSDVCETNRKNIGEYWEKKRRKEEKGRADLEEGKNKVDSHIPEYDANY
jgi:hypothetical protein